VAGRRDVCHATLTAPELMLRFVGNGLHPTDLTRVDCLARAAGQTGAPRSCAGCSSSSTSRTTNLAPELMKAIAERAAQRGLPVHLPRARGQLAVL